MSAQLFALHRQDEIGKSLTVKKDRAVILVPSLEEADLLWTEGLLATTALDSKWDAKVAEMLDFANVVVLGYCGGIEKLLDKANTRLYVPMLSVKDWFLTLPSPKNKAIADFCALARKGELKNGVPEVPSEDVKKVQPEAKKEPDKVLTLTEAQAKALVSRLRADAVTMGELMKRTLEVADKLEKMILPQ